MNREITTKKVGRQKKLTNPCPVIKREGEPKLPPLTFEEPKIYP